MRSAAPSTEPALGEPLKFHPKGTDPSPDPEWVDRINLDDRGLSSDFAIGAGTVALAAPDRGHAARRTGSGR